MLEIRRDEQRHLSSEIIQSNDSLLEAEAEHSIEVKMSELSGEIQKLMSLSVKQDDELQELELVSWQDKLKIETQQVSMEGGYATQRGGGEVIAVWIIAC